MTLMILAEQHGSATLFSNSVTAVQKMIQLLFPLHTWAVTTGVAKNFMDMKVTAAPSETTLPAPVMRTNQERNVFWATFTG